MGSLEFFGIAAGVIAGVSYLPYIRDILRRRVRPEGATWLIWAVLSGIEFFSQRSEGATFSLWLNGIDTIGIIAIVLLTVWFGASKWTRRHGIALFAAGVGLLLWYLTDEPVIALFTALAIDALGTVLTLIKTIGDSSSETYTMWVLGAVAGLLGIASVGSLNVELLIYPAYYFLLNFLVILAIRFGHHPRSKFR